MSSAFYSNRWKLFASQIANDSTFTLGVFFIFMLFLGLRVDQISFIISIQIAIFSLFSLLGGILADKYGQKNLLLLGAGLFLIGTICVAFGQNFYWFLYGYSLVGLGSALKQGSQSALLFESLKQDNQEEDFKRVAGKIDFSTNIVWVGSSILGGLLYAINHRFPFYAEIIVAVSGFVAITLLAKPSVVKLEEPLMERLKAAFSTTFSTKNFSKIFLFSALIGSVALTTIQYAQPLYKAIHIPEAYFGFIAAGFFLMRGLGSWYSNSLGKFFSVDKYLVLHAATFGLVLVLLQKLNSVFFVLPAFAILYFLRGLYGPTISTYIHERVESHERATILSINTLLVTLFTSLALIVLGFVATAFGLISVFFVISLLSLLLLIGYVLSLRKVETG
ncbi:MAG TPA: MFS transporter [Candidatus Eisenbacteria bacterium]|nr:MFS transporter [Candidatus Eisenbacteria bacterium]